MILAELLTGRLRWTENCLRVINVDLIKSRYEGLIVPVKSLVNIDMNTMRAEIALVKARRATFVPVKIVGKNDK